VVSNTTAIGLSSFPIADRIVRHDRYAQNGKRRARAGHPTTARRARLMGVGAQLEHAA
jgi:hypothetical protein